MLAPWRTSNGVLACLLALAASSAAACATTSTSSPIPSQPPPATSTVPSGHTELSGGTYLAIDGLEMEIDAFVPTTEGPWPVVVAFHERSSRFKDADSPTLLGERLAAAGTLVFTPTWIAGDPFPLDTDDIVDLRNAASCAVAFSQRWAAELGGDVDDTVVTGFSAGAGPALAATVAPVDAVPFCAVDAAPQPVVGAVLGDGEYFYQSAPFDTAFADDLVAMRSEVASLTDRERWPADLDAAVYVWAAAEGTAPRPIDDPAAPGWLDDRDPDGSIFADLVELDRVSDGVVDYVDGAHVVELRLREAGLDTELQIFPGGHTVVDKVDELVAAIASVGRTG